MFFAVWVPERIGPWSVLEAIDDRRVGAGRAEERVASPVVSPVVGRAVSRAADQAVNRVVNPVAAGPARGVREPSVERVHRDPSVSNDHAGL